MGGLGGGLDRRTRGRLLRRLGRRLRGRRRRGGRTDDRRGGLGRPGLDDRRPAVGRPARHRVRHGPDGHERCRDGHDAQAGDGPTGMVRGPRPPRAGALDGIRPLRLGWPFSTRSPPRTAGDGGRGGARSRRLGRTRRGRSGDRGGQRERRARETGIGDQVPAVVADRLVAAQAGVPRRRVATVGLAVRAALLAEGRRGVVGAVHGPHVSSYPRKVYREG